MISGTEVKIPCRISYAYINEPRESSFSGPRYSCTLLIDKCDESTVEIINDAINEAVRIGLQRKWNDAMPENMRRPLMDGDELRPNDPAYKDCWFITATSPNRPELVDQNVNMIVDRSRVYSGCYCNVVVEMYPYKSETTSGVAAELKYIQLVRSGESLQGKSKIHKWFQPVDANE